MPFDAGRRPTPAAGEGRSLKIAVIGSGISGLSAAWLLSDRHQVTIYEQDSRLGGHANTVDVPTAGGSIPVDSGFIVFNKPNYPNLTALFEHLGVRVETTDMSFGASIDDGAIEYSGQSLQGLFARPSSVVSPSHLAMLADIVRFNREAKAALARGIADDQSLADFVLARGLSTAFVRRFLEPMASAIWSTPSTDILNYPAASFFRFYDNHGLLQVKASAGRRWHTVTGGSREYVARISAPFAAGARVGVGVTGVRRVEGGVEVIDDSGHPDRFDHVVIATHGDQALRLLLNPTDAERSLLSAFRYQSNKAVVHFDEAQMPRRRICWSSWNYLGGDGAASVSYWMNRLQNLRCKEDVIVTLNPIRPVREDRIVAEFDYAHPMFDVAAMRAQRELWSLQGDGGVWYCGAHFGSGFHEDGAQAGLAVAEALGGVRRPWSVANESGRIHVGAGPRAAPLPMAAE